MDRFRNRVGLILGMLASTRFRFYQWLVSLRAREWQG